MIIKENTITEFIQHSTGFTISKSDLINGKVVVNNIEITSIEDWNKVTKLLIELQQENKKLHNKIDKAIEYMKDFIFEPLLVNEDRKLIMFNENLRKFEEILKDSDVDE